MAVKKSHAWFLECLEKTNPTINILGTYMGVKAHIQAQCKVCDHVWEAYSGGILRGSGCPVCNSSKRKKSLSSFLEDLSKTKVSVTLLTPYLYRAANIKVRCNVCNYVWDTKAKTLLKAEASGCLNCSGNTLKTHSQFLQDLYDVDSSIAVLSTYKDAKTKLDVRCNICNHKWSAKPPNLVTGYGCPKCSGNTLKTHDEFVSELAKVNNNIEVLTEYRRALEKVQIKCLTDGNIWWSTPDNLLHGRGCPICTKHGFRRNLSATLYVYKFQDYYGFGITNDIGFRNETHRRTFKKHGIQAELIKTYSGFGTDILRLENHLKKSLPIYDTGIEGFKTEAVEEHNGVLLFRAIDEHIAKYDIFPD